MLALLGVISYMLGNHPVIEAHQDSVWCQIFPPPTEKIDAVQTREEAFCAVIPKGGAEPDRLLLHEIKYNEKAEPLSRVTKNCKVTKAALGKFRTADQSCLPGLGKAKRKTTTQSFKFEQGTSEDRKKVTVGMSTYDLRRMTALDAELQPWDDRQGRLTDLPLVYSSSEPPVTLFKPKGQDVWHTKRGSEWQRLRTNSSEETDSTGEGSVSFVEVGTRAKDTTKTTEVIAIVKDGDEYAILRRERLQHNIVSVSQDFKTFSKAKKAEETQESSMSTPEVVPSGSEEKREPTEKSSISENVKKEEEKKSEEGTKEQTHNLESGTQTSLKLAELETSQHSQQQQQQQQQQESSSQDEETQTQTKESETPTSLKQAELEKSHRSQPRRSTSQDEETQTKGSNDSRQKIDDEDSDEYSDYEILEPEEEGKAKKKMGFRYEMKRKLINYKNRRENANTTKPMIRNTLRSPAKITMP
ncbi:hypothetical protein FOZ61_004055 [Perkinsus olseni]|uniref:Uncharacterized protein n=1 Tax=Perkinsus olseni TaxID=32597 RepID=A0A7J6LM69_PEROL|nr:hypothetical protein FOZ61_004055 [Perkinsus olseni]